MLGSGSFWGSPDVMMDDFMVYGRALSLLEVTSLTQMTDRADTDYVTDGIEETVAGETRRQESADVPVFDLSGRRVQVLKPGLYIKNGKKFIVR